VWANAVGNVTGTVTRRDGDTHTDVLTFDGRGRTWWGHTPCVNRTRVDAYRVIVTHDHLTKNGTLAVVDSRCRQLVAAEATAWMRHACRCGGKGCRQSNSQTVHETGLDEDALDTALDGSRQAHDSDPAYLQVLARTWRTPGRVPAWRTEPWQVTWARWLDATCQVTAGTVNGNDGHVTTGVTDHIEEIGYAVLGRDDITSDVVAAVVAVTGRAYRDERWDDLDILAARHPNLDTATAGILAHDSIDDRVAWALARNPAITGETLGLLPADVVNVNAADRYVDGETARLFTAMAPDWDKDAASLTAACTRILDAPS
jgi:hypothetical protein